MTGEKDAPADARTLALVELLSILWQERRAIQDMANDPSASDADLRSLCRSYRIATYSRGYGMGHEADGELAMTGEKGVASHEPASGETQPALRSTVATQAPAEMPGVYRIADEFERELFAWRNLPSRDGAALRACAYALAQKAETLFAPILAEKERDNRQLKLEVAAERETSRISIYGWRDKENEMEARALAAEAALAAVGSTIDEWSKPQTMKLHAGEMTAGEVRTTQAILKGVAAAIRAEGE